MSDCADSRRLTGIGPAQRHLREEEILRQFCHHRDRGELDHAVGLWQELALRNLDRVTGFVKAFRFQGGGRLSVDEVADAAQEAYLRVVAMGPNFRESALGQFRAALAQCVKNACLDYGRKELRHDKHAAGSLDAGYPDSDEGSPYDAAIARHSREREELAEEALADEDRSQEAHDLLVWAIAQIPNPGYQEVLYMTYIEKLAGDEIAERLDITPANVYQRRRRGMLQLERILRDPGS